ncbi:MAG: relaxase domain-containing protein, partial [Bifidobacteriaceae bacterium]|nr:relaxase domain-containing protein [Bifidobacteriaceae bacterium]
MTVSFRIMSAGTGYEYLLKSVVTGDGNRDLSSPLTRYYAEQGTPPGVWRGRGVAHLGEGRLATGQQVTEQHLQLLMGYGRDPVTGMPLGRAYPKYTNLGPRTAARASVPPSALPVEEPTVRTNRADEGTRATPARRAVAGYDITMSVPKSVSALWGLADAGTQALIAAAHHEAVGTAIDFFEREIAATRGGATRPATGNSPGGAVVQLPVDGVSAACFDHWDSRAGDPQLHTHAVLSAKVCAADDGRWLALDGRPVHYSMVALSEFYNAVLADNLARTLGLAWERRTRPREKNPAWELARVPEALIGEFSTRTKTIDTETDRLISQYTTTKGHRPSQRTILRLRQQATLATRPDKQLHSLADLTANWRQRAAVVLDDDATSWARQATSVREPVVLLRTDDIPVETIEELGRSVVAAVG